MLSYISTRTMDGLLIILTLNKKIFSVIILIDIIIILWSFTALNCKLRIL